MLSSSVQPCANLLVPLSYTLCAECALCGMRDRRLPCGLIADTLCKLLQVTPMGAGTEMGEQVVTMLDALDDRKLNYEVGAVSTVVEGELHEVC